MPEQDKENPQNQSGLGGDPANYGASDQHKGGGQDGQGQVSPAEGIPGKVGAGGSGGSGGQGGGSQGGGSQGNQQGER
jgi:hypothetical protein